MLILIRGLPGSGKSTLARSIAFNREHYEADDYWKDRRFDPKFLHLAHKECQEKTRKALREGKDVIVANTFTRLWEMQPYLEMTEDVVVYRATGKFESIHCVPQKTIDKMKRRFEDYDGEIYHVR